MSKQREAFDLWLKAQNDGATGYDIWQASRAAALEEAAGLTIQMYGFYTNAEVVAAIRALKEQS